MTRILISESIAVETSVVGVQENLVPQSLFPADVETLTAQDIIDALGEALDGRARPDLFIADDSMAPPFGRSWEYDFLHFQWHRPGQGLGPIITTGLHTLEQWIYKCLITDRGAHPIHPSGYGMVRPFDVVSDPMAGVPYESLDSRVTDALVYHPRIKDVRNFEVIDSDPDEDFIGIAFDVILDDESVIPIQTNVPG
jgi:hypothetical protein